MAFAKKYSRKIIVDEIEYRWLVSGNDGYNVFVAQNENANAGIIEVYFKTDINSLWVEFPNIQDLNLKILTPKDAENIIRQALQLGWNPEEKGRPVVYNFSADILTSGRPTFQ